MAAAAAVTALLAALGVLLAASRALGGRYGAAAGYGLLAVSLGTLALSLWRLAPDLGSYRPAADGDALAEFVFERTGPAQFRVTMTRLPDGQMTVFEMHGEEWRVQARRLGWAPADWDPGIGSRLRLELLESRYLESDTPSPTPPSVYGLAAATRSDVWSRAQAGRNWSGLLGADLAETEWYPMVHRARLKLRISGGALLAEALNEAAAASFPPPS